MQLSRFYSAHNLSKVQPDSVATDLDKPLGANGMLRTIKYGLERINWAWWMWGAWFGLAGLALLTGWEGFMWASKWMVYLFAGTLFVGFVVMAFALTWDTATKLVRWMMTTKEEREREKAARKTRRIDAPFDHWEPPAGRD